MDDSTALFAGQSKKYNLPLSHFEHKYIQNCTDAKELEHIYTELITGEIGSFPDLERLTLERIQKIKPNSKVLRQDKAPLDISALPDDESRQFNEFLNQMKTFESSIDDQSKNTLESVPVRSKVPIVVNPVKTQRNGKAKRVLPRSYDEWGKLDKKISEENSSDEEEPEKRKSPAVKQRIEETKSNLDKAEEYRLIGNNEFRNQNYQKSIEAYTNSIRCDSNNTVVHMNRALAYYKINDYESSLNDCSLVLKTEPDHIKALFRRASCHVAKKQYEEARQDLDHLLSVDPTNVEAKNLLEKVPVVQKPKGVRIPITEEDSDEEEQVDVRPSVTRPVKIPIMEVDDEDETEQLEEQPVPIIESPSTSISVDIPSSVHARPCIDSQEGSPALYGQYLDRHENTTAYNESMQHQFTSLEGLSGDDEQRHDTYEDDDDMPLGDEAGSGLLDNMSDDEVNSSRNFNVSPTAVGDDEDERIPQLVEQNSMQISPPIVSNQLNNRYDRMDDVASPRYETTTDHSSISSKNNIPLVERTEEHRSASLQSHHDQIDQSNFGPLIQSLLHETVEQQAIRRPGSIRERPWSRSLEPRLLNKLQRDIDRFYRSSDYFSTIEASKKMLRNGILNYHNHAFYIVDTLTRCAQCCLKLKKTLQAIQYATEALQYNKTDTTALMCRAKAFEEEELYLESYLDYSRVPQPDFSYSSAQNACEELIVKLKEKMGDEWFKQIPTDNDEQRYFEMMKIKDPPTTNLYDWYRLRSNQLYLDSCFILCIRGYSRCIELQPNLPLGYLNRAACYLKLFEPYKTIEDCHRVIQLKSNNPRALYRMACAYKMAGDQQAYVKTLQDLIEIQPNNQIVLSEYYNARHETIPRQMRRLRATSKPTENTNSATKDSTATNESSANERIGLTYEELEDIRMTKAPPLSSNLAYQFLKQFEALKTDDLKGQCALFLRLANQSLFKFSSSASPKLVEMTVRVCEAMVHAERQHQKQNKTLIVPFSYIQYSFQLLTQLTTLQRIESVLLMIDQYHRAALDDLLIYYNSLSSMFHDVQKLDRLRK